MHDIKKIITQQFKNLDKNELLSLSISLDEISISEKQFKEELKRLSFTWSSVVTVSKNENNSYTLTIKDNAENLMFFATNVDTLTFYLDSLR